MGQAESHMPATFGQIQAVFLLDTAAISVAAAVVDHTDVIALAGDLRPFSTSLRVGPAKERAERLWENRGRPGGKPGTEDRTFSRFLLLCRSSWLVSLGEPHERGGSLNLTPSDCSYKQYRKSLRHPPVTVRIA